MDTLTSDIHRGAEYSTADRNDRHTLDKTDTCVSLDDDNGGMTGRKLC